jgi:hypothetical protein
MIYRTKLIGALLMLLATAASAQQAVEGKVDFIENFVEVKGIGIPAANVPADSPQAYATARRAAVVDANRNLAEMISTIQIDSQSVNELSQAVQDTVRSSVSAKLRGGQAVRETTMTEFVGSDVEKRGKVEVIVRVPLNGSGGVLSAIMPALAPEIIKRTNEASLPAFVPPPTAATAPAAPRPATPAPAAPAAAAPAAAPADVVEYDGLIVRVPSSFKPAIAPKIFTEKGEVLYSAKDVAMDILISRGAAQYTNNEGKAKAVLEGMGSKAILSLDGGIRTDTDAEIKGPDAAKVFGANKKTAFLNKGRVVFLVAKSL